MKRLFLMLASVFLLASCDPSSFRVEKGSQSDGGGGGLGAGKDVTNIIYSHFRQSNTLVGGCQLASTSPMLWSQSMINTYSDLGFETSFYSDNSCSTWVATRSLNFNFNKVTTTQADDEYLLQVELYDTSLYIHDPINYVDEDFYDFSTHINELFFWQVKIDSSVRDSDISMPTYQEIMQPSSEASPIMTSEMYDISRGG